MRLEIKVSFFFRSRSGSKLNSPEKLTSFFQVCQTEFSQLEQDNPTESRKKEKLGAGVNGTKPEKTE